MDVRINGRLYRNVESMLTSKIEHVLQLAKHEVANYRKMYSDFDQQAKKKPNLLIHLAQLQAKVTQLEALVYERVDP